MSTSNTGSIFRFFIFSHFEFFHFLILLNMWTSSTDLIFLIFIFFIFYVFILEFFSICEQAAKVQFLFFLIFNSALYVDKQYRLIFSNLSVFIFQFSSQYSNNQLRLNVPKPAKNTTVKERRFVFQKYETLLDIALKKSCTGAILSQRENV